MDLVLCTTTSIMHYKVQISYSFNIYFSICSGKLKHGCFFFACAHIKLALNMNFSIALNYKMLQQLILTFQSFTNKTRPAICTSNIPLHSDGGAQEEKKTTSSLCVLV